jgi:NAD(P)-dependent dehydrogenase (short-subunit alcohol dehydrogenase family)
MNKKDKDAVVTGSSRGIGFETSLTLARNGFLIYATMRNLQKEKNISLISDKERIPLKTLQLDVTDSSSVNNAIKVL